LKKEEKEKKEKNRRREKRERKNRKEEDLQRKKERKEEEKKRKNRRKTSTFEEEDREYDSCAKSKGRLLEGVGDTVVPLLFNHLLAPALGLAHIAIEWIGSTKTDKEGGTKNKLLSFFLLFCLF